MFSLKIGYHLSCSGQALAGMAVWGTGGSLWVAQLLELGSNSACSRAGCLKPWEGLRAVLGLSRVGSRAENRAPVACGFLTGSSLVPRQNQG